MNVLYYNEAYIIIMFLGMTDVLILVFIHGAEASSLAFVKIFQHLLFLSLTLMLNAFLFVFLLLITLISF